MIIRSFFFQSKVSAISAANQVLVPPLVAAHISSRSFVQTIVPIILRACAHPPARPPARVLPLVRGPPDVLIHQYEGVDRNRVWAIVEKDLPGLKQSIASLLPPLKQLERELSGEEEAPEGR